MANDNLSFSQRHGHKPVKATIQVNSVDDDLRNSLWSVAITHVLQKPRDGWIPNDVDLHKLLKGLWFSYFKKPLDELDDWWKTTYQEIRDYFFSCKWHEVYDFIEFVGQTYPSETYLNERKRNQFVEACNRVLEREVSGYRFVGNRIAQITSETEIAEIEQALQESPAAVARHLKAGLNLYVDRKLPDYSNSIKESISAVEAMCGLIVGKGKPTLGDALQQIETNSPVKLHPSLKIAFEKLYGYTSNAEGIRHALLGEPTLDSEDAKFMLVSCSAFINYLTVKASKAGLDLSDL
ncbi:MAG: hypothetical protein AAB502_06720 [Chloroflexota bacterium]